MIKFIVLGKPIGKGRPKFSMRGSFPIVYTPKNTVDYETLIKLEAKKYKPKTLLLGAIVLKLNIFFPILKSMNKQMAKMARELVLRPTKKPDVSNILKCVEDALNLIIWHDDSQIVEEHIYKYYSDNPRVEIEIDELS